MSAEHYWFVAEAVFQATVHTEKGKVRPAIENMLFLVKAVDQAAAVSRAETVARAKEHSYENETGELVSWAFVRIVDVTEMIDQQFEEGAELKSTMTEMGSDPIVAERR